MTALLDHASRCAVSPRAAEVRPVAYPLTLPVAEVLDAGALYGNARLVAAVAIENGESVAIAAAAETGADAAADDSSPSSMEPVLVVLVFATCGAPRWRAFEKKMRTWCGSSP